MAEKKNKGGRPPKYKTAEELQAVVDQYFADCDENEEPYTITGLALATDLSRLQLIQYSEKEKFYNTIKKAKLKCQNYAEKFLYSGKNATGAIFNLKNNYGWKDKIEAEVGTSGDGLNIKVEFVDAGN